MVSSCLAAKTFDKNGGTPYDERGVPRCTLLAFSTGFASRGYRPNQSCGKWCPMSSVKKLFSNIWFLFAMLVLIWSAYATINKFILMELDNYQSIFWIFLTSSVSYLATLPRSASMKENMELRDILKAVGLGAIAFSYYFFYALALHRVPVVEASALNYLYPLMTVLFAAVIFKEKLTPVKIAAVLLGLLGVFIIVTKGNFSAIRLSDPLGDLSGLLCAVAWGLFSNLGRTMKKNPFLCNLIYVLTSFALSAVSMLVFSEFKLPSLRVLILCAIVGLLNLNLGYTVWFKLLNELPTTLVASVTFITPCLNLLVIVVVLGETVTSMQLLGAGVVIFGIMLQSGVLTTLLRWGRENLLRRSVDNPR